MSYMMFKYLGENIQYSIINIQCSVKHRILWYWLIEH